MNLMTNPDLSHKAAKAVQFMPLQLKARFVEALQEADSIKDLSKQFQDYLANGYKPSPSDIKPDKVVTTLEEALEGVVIEWNN
jgi:hypothetical protein